jgi:hypothetical protein
MKAADSTETTICHNRKVVTHREDLNLTQFFWNAYIINPLKTKRICFIDKDRVRTAL